MKYPKKKIKTISSYGIRFCKIFSHRRIYEEKNIMKSANGVADCIISQTILGSVILWILMDVSITIRINMISCDCLLRHTFISPFNLSVSVA